MVELKPLPLTQRELVESLRALAGVAAGDAHHDFGTLLDVFNERRTCSGESPLLLAEQLQIARAVRLRISPNLERDAVAGHGDLRFINQYLYERGAAKRDNPESARMVLSRLVYAAAILVEAGLPRQDRPTGPGNSATPTTAGAGVLSAEAVPDIGLSAGSGGR